MMKDVKTTTDALTQVVTVIDINIKMFTTRVTGLQYLISGNTICDLIHWHRHKGTDEPSPPPLFRLDLRKKRKEIIMGVFSTFNRIDKLSCITAFGQSIINHNWSVQYAAELMV